MNLRLTCMIAPCLALALAAADRVPKLTWKTKVDGTTFRVTRDEHGVLNVVSKAMVTGRTMDMRDKMRIAVRQATGCEIADELWFDAKLKGKLTCPDGHVLPPGTK